MKIDRIYDKNINNLVVDFRLEFQQECKALHWIATMQFFFKILRN